LSKDQNDGTIKVVYIKYATDRRLINEDLQEILQENKGKNLSFIVMEGEEKWHIPEFTLDSENAGGKEDADR